MLDIIIQALIDFRDHGKAVVAPTEDTGLDARDVAPYVLAILNGLKCSYDVNVCEEENKVVIEDCMTH